MDIYEAIHALNDAEFIDEEDKKIFIEYLKDPCAILMEMSTLRGKDVKTQKLPFSFWYSPKGAVHGTHCIRVKIKWIDNKINSNDTDGTLALHGNYEYTPGSHKYKPNAKELNEAREFFKIHKVLFAAVWEEVLHQVDLEDYFKGNLSFNALIDTFQVSPEHLYELQGCYTLEELEDCVRKYKMFNMND